MTRIAKKTKGPRQKPKPKHKPRRKRMRLVVLLAIPTVIVVGGGMAVAAVLLVRTRGDTPSQPSPEPTVTPVQLPPEPAPRPTEIIDFADGCMAADCHGPMADRPHVHQTFADEACDLCHAPDTGGHIYPQLVTTEDTCTSCHDTGADHRFQHKAMSDEACLACHDPHGSGSPALLVADTTEATCLRCHPQETDAVTHEPYVTDHCGECHDPHGAGNAMLLLGGEGADHCRNCHNPMVKAIEAGSHTHLEVEGACLGCHEAHTAGQAGLLVAPIGELCITCHEDVGQAVAGATVSHESVLTGKQCLACHDPHTSEYPAMLRETEALVCLSCHDEPVTAPDGREIAALAPALDAAGMVHGAITIGECSACHSVHGSSHDRLLGELNPTVFVGPYDAQNYALCFACHDTRLAETPAATRFRDGDKNLHAAHLRARDRSGGCADCHSVHAGNLPRLIVEEVHYQGSDWATPMGFVLAPDGGRCAPGCHEPLAYSRLPGGARAKSNGESP